MKDVHILKLHCPDAVGLLARITSVVAARGGNLLDASQFTDLSSGWFFVRLAIAPGNAAWNVEGLREDLGQLASELRAQWSFWPEADKMRAAIFVSRQDHCLADLIWRWRCGELPIQIAVVISNHEICRPLVEREGLTFHHHDFASDKERAFRQAFDILQAQRVDIVVLARFMQIVPGWLCQEYAGRMINIHHSFLPAFVGANPYRRAFERGVKLIGATCHYVTEELDAGPIIEQEVVRVEHYHDPEDLSRLGRDCERLALARGVRYHAEGRVLLHGTRAIVFRD